MDKETNNDALTNELKEILFLLKKALIIYVSEGQDRIIENEEYELYKEQYPFDEYYCFKEAFRGEWE